MTKKFKAALLVALMTTMSVVFNLLWVLSNVEGAAKFLTAPKTELMKLNQIQLLEVQHPFNMVVFGMLFIVMAPVLGGFIIRDILQQNNNNKNDNNNND